MRLSRDVTGPCLISGSSVVAIGAFDGLHRGHQALLSQVRVRSLERGCVPVAVSFEPLPRTFFSKEPVPRLSSVREKLNGFAIAGMADVLMLRFNATLANMSAQDFVLRVLVERLAVREVWVGADFRFGQKRAGAVDLLVDMGAELGFAVQVMPSVLLGGTRISASRIRALLAADEFAGAAQLLGRPFVIEGRVMRGNQVGRTLGFPTANLSSSQRVKPVHGIFAVRVGMDESPCSWPGVASLGLRPTVNSVSEPLLEAHLFDFDGDLYGRRMAVEFVAKLRDEEKFSSLDALKTQMVRDARAAREILGMSPALT